MLFRSDSWLLQLENAVSNQIANESSWTDISGVLIGGTADIEHNAVPSEILSGSGGILVDSSGALLLEGGLTFGDGSAAQTDLLGGKFYFAADAENTEAQLRMVMLAGLLPDDNFESEFGEIQGSADLSVIDSVVQLNINGTVNVDLPGGLME